MRKKVHGEKGAHAGMTLMSGDSHLGIANRYIQTIPYDASTVIKYLPKNTGGLFAAAVNLSFSIELYLKSCLIRDDVEFDPKHDLKYLYDLLPASTKDQIKTEYKAYKPRPDNPFDKFAYSGQVDHLFRDKLISDSGLS